MFAAFIYAVKLSLKPANIAALQGRTLECIVGFTLLILTVLLFVPGVLSTDLFSYSWYGRILVTFRQNPLTHVPADYYWYDRGNWLQWVVWKETPSVFGPVWLVFAGVIGEVAYVLGGALAAQVTG